MEELFNQLLDYYSLSMEEYDYITRPLSFSDIHDPYEFKGMLEAINIVKLAIKNKDKIIVFGDYDCDGMMATSIVAKSFIDINYPIDYYIPSRYLNGYGFNLDKAKEYIHKGYKLIITVDNGITANEAIDYCIENGVKVIIIDHHEQGDVLPQANAIIHPQVSEFSNIKTSAGFCSFMFSIALLKRINPYLLTLGAISVISDMMPLKEFNRDIVRLATSLYRNGEYYNIDLLREDDEFNYQSIGMRIAPKINAIGRLVKDEEINNLIPFFINEDKTLLSKLYFWINENNENRKSISQNNDIKIDEEDLNKDGIVILTHLEEGMLGIMANKLLNIYKKPVVVLTYSSLDNSILQGSCRALEGFNIVKCFEDLNDILINAGGHALAGGLSLKESDYKEFKRRFIEACTSHPPMENKEKTIELNIQDVNLSTYRLIETFSPFGEEWKSPILSLKHLKTSTFMYSKNSEHILTPIGQSAKLVGFNMARKDISKYPYIDVTGNISYYVYKGYGTVQFLIKKSKPSE